jgi:predicted alpha/beta superfamily hydrolase
VRCLLASVLLCACGDPSSILDAGADARESRDAHAIDAHTIDAPAVSDAGEAEDIVDIESALEVLGDPEASDEDLDTLMRDVAFTSGWPMHEGTRWLFATRWDGAPEPVAFVSDVNAWNPEAHVAQRAASGVHYYAIVDESELAAPALGAKYKWHGAGDVFRAPPEALAYGFDGFGEFGWVAPPIDAPHLERFADFRSAFLGLPRAIRAYLPAAFEPRSDAAARARVLLLHDGQNVFHPNAPHGGWRADVALADGYDDVVAIAIDNAPDRFDAYTHVADDPLGSLAGGRASDYLRAIEEEVLPFVRARYGLEGPLAIAGSSLGGLVSLYIANERPALARCTIAMSSTLGWGAYRAGPSDALLDRWTAHGASAIYLDSGGAGECADLDGDGIDEDSDDSDNYCVTLQLRDHLDAIGYGFGVDLAHYHAPGATHDEAAWAARLPRALAACESMGW